MKIEPNNIHTPWLDNILVVLSRTGYMFTFFCFLIAGPFCLMITISLFNNIFKPPTTSAYPYNMLPYRYKNSKHIHKVDIFTFVIHKISEFEIFMS